MPPSRSLYIVLPYDTLCPALPITQTKNQNQTSYVHVPAQRPCRPRNTAHALQAQSPAGQVLKSFHSPRSGVSGGIRCCDSLFQASSAVQTCGCCEIFVSADSSRQPAMASDAKPPSHLRIDAFNTLSSPARFNEPSLSFMSMERVRLPSPPLCCQHQFVSARTRNESYIAGPPPEGATLASKSLPAQLLSNATESQHDLRIIRFYFTKRFACCCSCT